MWKAILEENCETGLYTVNFYLGDHVVKYLQQLRCLEALDHRCLEGLTCALSGGTGLHLRIGVKVRWKQLVL